MVWENDSWKKLREQADRLTRRFPAGMAVQYRMVPGGELAYGVIASGFCVLSNGTVNCWVDRCTLGAPEALLPTTLIERDGQPLEAA